MANKIKRTNISMSEETLELADKFAEQIGVKRSAFISFLIRQYSDEYDRNQAQMAKLMLASMEKEKTEE